MIRIVLLSCIICVISHTYVQQKCANE
jgi:hypothetical protein